MYRKCHLCFSHFFATSFAETFSPGRLGALNCPGHELSQFSIFRLKSKKTMAPKGAHKPSKDEVFTKSFNNQVIEFFYHNPYCYGITRYFKRTYPNVRMIFQLFKSRISCSNQSK